MERKEQRVEPLTFQGPSVDLDAMRYGQGLKSQIPLVDGFEYESTQKAWRLAREEFEGNLVEELRELQDQNGDWAEGRLDLLRERHSDWSIDTILVNSEGRIKFNEDVGTTACFSFYRMYTDPSLKRVSSSLPKFDAAELVSLRDREEEWYFPLNARRDSVLFWPADFDEPVLGAITDGVGSDLDLGEYPVKFGGLNLRMGRVVRNKVGPGRFAKRGVTFGTVGFWERGVTPVGYWPRVEFKRSSLNKKQTIVSGMDKGAVIATGGKLMDEKHPSVDVLRPERELLDKDFIAASAVTVAERFYDQPFVLRYNPPRPWFGEIPKHPQ